MRADAWAAERLGYVPQEWQPGLMREHGRRLAAAERLTPGTGQLSAAVRAANLWLYELTERMRGVRVPVYMSDAELCDFARERAREAFSLAEALPGRYLSAPDFRARLAAFVCRYGINPPEPLRVTKKGSTVGVADAPAIRRMTCDLWWRRRLRVSQCRAVEGFAVELGRVHVRSEVYASDATVNRRQQQRQRNRLAMEATECVNLDTGEVFNLAELADKGTANKALRRAEFMTRVAGFDAVSRVRGDAAFMLTLTTPSKYHRMKTFDGKPVRNKKWNGCTPREASLYLTTLFQRMRAKWQRKGIRPYGFRVTEPHHDGTPHWHMLVFVPQEQADLMLQIFAEYAMKEDGNEPGAKERRYDVEPIDLSKGTATSYIAKYVSKNIDGHGITDGDWEGQVDAATGAIRVDAWCSAWGIRQFQQIGGAPVGMWRELRRMEANEGHGEVLRRAMSAADAGNWQAFIDALGGVDVPRKALPLRLAKTEPGKRWDYFGGCAYVAAPGQYGEEAGAAVFGVDELGKVWPSRRFRWEMRHGAKSADKKPCFTVLSGSVLGGRAQPDRPWSPVNNCTHEGKANERSAANQGGMVGSDGGGESGKSCRRAVEESAITFQGHGRGLHRTATVGHDAPAAGHRPTVGATGRHARNDRRG